MTRFRTVVYIDGFNLYFGCLKRARQFRWLDVVALAESLCRKQGSPSELIMVKYFTVFGSYHEDPASKPVDFSKKLRVLRPEEKQTDVNIALHMLADATDGICDQQILVSNDSDCMPALRMIRKRHPELRLGVVAPILKEAKEGREPSRQFRGYVDWIRSTISEVDLASCQLPDIVATRKRKIKKPEHWQ